MPLWSGGLETMETLETPETLEALEALETLETLETLLDVRRRARVCCLGRARANPPVGSS